MIPRCDRSRPGPRRLFLGILMGLLPLGLLSFPFSLLAEEEASETPQRVERTEVHMGTQFKLIAYGSQPETTERAISDAFARISELDSRLSDYQSSSELNQLSLSAPHSEWREVSLDLWNVLVESQRVSELSSGTFDVTVGPLTRLWRRARRRQEPPAAELLKEAWARVGHEKLVLRDREDSSRARQVRLLQPQMRLDLGGIAKGYAVEEALRVLERWGIDRALVDGGGDLAVGAPPPGQPGWRIGIAPLQVDSGPSHFISLSHRSIATSGDFWQYIEIDGVRYSHILDPRTGCGVTRRSTVTVIARRGSLADALASAVSVMGPEQGMELVRNWEDVELLVLAQPKEGGRQPELARAGQDTPKTPTSSNEEQASQNRRRSPVRIDAPKPTPTRELESEGGQRVEVWTTPGFDRYLERPEP